MDLKYNCSQSIKVDILSLTLFYITIQPKQPSMSKIIIHLRNAIKTAHASFTRNLLGPLNIKYTGDIYQLKTPITFTIPTPFVLDDVTVVTTSHHQKGIHIMPPFLTDIKNTDAFANNIYYTADPLTVTHLESGKDTDIHLNNYGLSFIDNMITVSLQAKTNEALYFWDYHDTGFRPHKVKYIGDGEYVHRPYDAAELVKRLQEKLKK